MPRVVNPVFQTTIVLEDMVEHDRLVIKVRDVGMLQEAHIGGFGPRDVAGTSVPLRDFAGWLELTPEVEVAGNGGPVMCLVITVRPTGFDADRLGVIGSVAESRGHHVAESRGPDVLQAFAGLEPSAPTIPSEPEPSPDGMDSAYVFVGEVDESRRWGDTAGTAAGGVAESLGGRVPRDQWGRRPASWPTH